MDNPPKNKQEELNSFRNEITKIKELELKNKEAGGDDATHLIYCNPVELNEGDKILYERYISDNLTTIEELEEETSKSTTPRNNSQRDFVAYIRSMLARKISTEDLKKWKENRKLKNEGTQ